MLETEISPLTGEHHVFRSQRAPHALLSFGRGINGVMQKPGALVIPKIMVGVCGNAFRGGDDEGHNGERILPTLLRAKCQLSFSRRKLLDVRH